MNLPQTISLISTSVLTVVAVIIGIQLIVILKEIKQSLTRFNRVLDTADTAFQRLSQPATAIAGLMEGFKESSKIIAGVSDFLGRFSSQKPVDTDFHE